MKDGTLILLIVTLAGLLGGNDLMAIAAGLVCLLSLIAPPPIFDLLDRYGIPTGIIFLTIGILLPFANGKLGFSALANTLFSPTGVLAIAVGVVSSYLAADGIKLLVIHPEVMVGLVIGTIIGVSYFGGIPVGPLVAAGFAAFIYRLLRF